MTNKQIIIDGCEFQSDCIEYKDISYLKIMPICAIHELSIACHDKVNKCKYYKLYKQLKRKEQSEAKLAKQIQTICDFINNRPEIFKGIYGSVDKIITEYAERKEQECEELKKELMKKDELNTFFNTPIEGWSNDPCEIRPHKAENDKYSLFIEKLCDYAGLECDDEEQAMRTLSDLASQINKAVWIIDRYKQTLTEIKEILEIHKDNKCAICPKFDECFEHPSCDNIILQKISQCEVENEHS